MRGYLKKLPKEIKELIYFIKDIADRNNMPIYLVGGFVRDLLLGVKNLDLDFVVEGDGIKFAEELARRLRAKIICHRRFGTATIILRQNLKIDIATARKETYPQPASLPAVSCGRLKDDLARRDFTINAMAVSICGRDFGRLIDMFDGSGDLRRRQIRVLHNLSFIDDPTRMLRAVRFEQRFNFRIEPNTLRLLRAARSIKMLERVQPQRLRDEVILILKEACPLKQIRRIRQLLGFSFISRKLTALKVSLRFLSCVERQIKWFAGSYPHRRQLDTWLIYFMGLLDALKISEIKEICRGFAFRRGEEKRILSYKRIGPKFIRQLQAQEIKPSRIFSLLEPLSYEVILALKAKNGDRNIQKHVEDFFEIYNGMRISISGDDLRRLGITPGPYYQKIFSQVLKAKLDKKIKTPEDELALIRKLARSA